MRVGTRRRAPLQCVLFLRVCAVGFWCLPCLCRLPQRTTCSYTVLHKVCGSGRGGRPVVLLSLSILRYILQLPVECTLHRHYFHRPRSLQFNHLFSFTVFKRRTRDATSGSPSHPFFVPHPLPLSLSSHPSLLFLISTHTRPYLPIQSLSVDQERSRK